MKELKNYEACEIELLPLTDVITFSIGFDGDEDDFYPNAKTPYDVPEW